MPSTVSGSVTMNKTDVVSVFLVFTFVGEDDRMFGYKCDLSATLSYSKDPH